MSLPEFTIAIWIIPHRAHGYIAEIDASRVVDGIPGGVFQSFQDVKTTPSRSPEVQYEFPHCRFDVSAEAVRAIIELADRIKYSLVERPSTLMFGGAFFGLRVSRGFQETTVVWQGKYDDQDGSIRNLYSYVRDIAEA
jgi:hypothetical protein